MHRDPARTPVVVDALRTPFGRYGGALASVRPDDLAAFVIRELVTRTGVDPASVDDVILGAANQAGEDNRNVGRMALLLAGLPVSVAGQTINRLCGSGMSAVVAAAHAIVAGSTPATAEASIRTIGFQPADRARASEVTNRAAAPSLIPLLLPAVTVPSSSRRNAGLSEASCSRVVAGRGCSSWPSSGIGLTSSSNRPASKAAAHRCWELRANASWSSRLTPIWATTFSAVSPMEYG